MKRTSDFKGGLYPCLSDFDKTQMAPNIVLWSHFNPEMPSCVPTVQDRRWKIDAIRIVNSVARFFFCLRSPALPGFLTPGVRELFISQTQPRNCICVQYLISRDISAAPALISSSQGS